MRLERRGRVHSRQRAARDHARARPTANGRSSAPHASAFAARTASVGRAAICAANSSVHARRSAPAPPRRRSRVRAHRRPGSDRSTGPSPAPRSCPRPRQRLRTRRPPGSCPPAPREVPPRSRRPRGDSRTGGRARSRTRPHSRASTRPSVPRPPARAPTRLFPNRVTHRRDRGRGPELLEIGAGREVITGGGEEHDPHTGIGDHTGEHLAERISGGNVVDVDRRVIEDDLGGSPACETRNRSSMARLHAEKVPHRAFERTTVSPPDRDRHATHRPRPVPPATLRSDRRPTPVRVSAGRKRAAQPPRHRH